MVRSNLVAATCLAAAILIADAPVKAKTRLLADLSGQFTWDLNDVFFSGRHRRSSRIRPLYQLLLQLAA